MGERGEEGKGEKGRAYGPVAHPCHVHRLAGLDVVEDLEVGEAHAAGADAGEEEGRAGEEPGEIDHVRR